MWCISWLDVTRGTNPGSVCSLSCPGLILSVFHAVFYLGYFWLGRLPKVDLIILEGGKMSVRTSVRTSVRPSVHKKFLRFQWNLVCRYRSMIDARRYAVWPDPRSRSRSPALESLNSFHFQNLSPPPFTTGAGKWPLILKLEHNI